MFILCMTENRGGMDQLNIPKSVAFVCLITNQPFNYSKYIFEGMKWNVTGVLKDKFLMYPRFLQMMFNACYPELERSGNTLELKPLGPACFGALTTKKGTEKKFEGLIPLEKFGQFAETEDVAAEPVLVLLKMSLGQSFLQSALTMKALKLVVMMKMKLSFLLKLNLAQLLKSITEKMGNPPSNPLVQIEEQTFSDLKDPENQPLKQKRRDPRSGVYVEQSKDQPMNDAEDEDGLYDVDFEKDVTATETIPTVTTVSAPVTESTPPVTVTIASLSGTVHEEPCSISGKRPEELVRMSFVHDSSDDDEFISMREMMKRMMLFEQDSIHKDAKILQLEDTIVQKNQQIDKLQGDESRRKPEEDRARAFAKDDAERNAAMNKYFERVTDREADKSKAERVKKKRELVVLKNKNLNLDDDDAQITHHLMDVGENYYDKVRNRSGFVSWGFDHDRRRW
ncbi:hypothetical protein HanXRQr2_Chr04g0169841 [Helianthus annuus]|uniref:Uncharacterized protein n=1 Tax=Helianthus annuus TaxID=4232 RepID=A0A9K3NRI8_HELAN|nr:hypothetical protein HanXRQr2_Chr04g0169841 [Helianthus annuus]KAJ0589201.1 hypothetical protein HanIR_Chr04g0183381 [Helianthus annuus]KAJ0931579.1 hypothetical protein HanPSC8_Chr04g0163361 [Helianthus annuus]